MWNWINSHLPSQGRNGLSCLAIALTLFGGSKGEGGVVVEKGIRITNVQRNVSSLEITWTPEDDRITEGDEYIILMRTRQIPARKGWSAWKEVGRTKESAFSTQTFTLDKDIQLKIRVDKGGIE